MTIGKDIKKARSIDRVKMNLKERILKEMIVDEEAVEIWRELPSFMQTNENYDKIVAKLKNIGRVK